MASTLVVYASSSEESDKGKVGHNGDNITVSVQEAKKSKELDAVVNLADSRSDDSGHSEAEDAVRRIKPRLSSSGSSDEHDERKRSPKESRKHSSLASSSSSRTRRKYDYEEESSRHRRSMRDYRSPDRHSRHSRYNRDRDARRSRSPERHSYYHHRHRSHHHHNERYQSHRHQDRRSKSTSPVRRSSVDSYKRDNEKGVCSSNISGGKSIHENAVSGTGLKDIHSQAVIENQGQSSRPIVTDPGSNVAKPGQSVLQLNSADAETTQEATIKSVLHGNQLILAAKAAIQNQKRKLLWSGKKKVDQASKSSTWNAVSFEDDSSEQKVSKFKRLMGMSGDLTTPVATTETTGVTGDEEKVDTSNISKDECDSNDSNRQNKLLHDLQQQYDAARVITHTQRGFGLGFSSN